MSIIPSIDCPRTTSEDANLVQRFKQGEVEAFKIVSVRYRQMLSSVVLDVLHDPSDAEEIAQETITKAYLGRETFRGDCALATWLRNIAFNIARNRYWYYKRRHRLDSHSLDTPLSLNGEPSSYGELLASNLADPVQESVREEFSHLVLECIASLDRNHREILTMRAILDLSYSEIAGRLNLQMGTVKTRISRAREKLRILLGVRCPEFGSLGKVTEYFVPDRPIYGGPQRAV